ncbi:MAG: c-type cytochrome [Anaerolineales bacterium]
MRLERGLLLIAALAAVAVTVWMMMTATYDSSLIIINNTAVPPVPTLGEAAAEQGEALYAAHCAACHGANLEGQPNWKQRNADGVFPAPPHDNSGHTWHHSDEVLLYITANGSTAFDPTSKMPAFQGKLTEAEMRAVLTFIKSHWGRTEREHQWWVTATRNDAGVSPNSGK